MSQPAHPLAAAIVAAFEVVVKINLLSGTMFLDQAAYRSAESCLSVPCIGTRIQEAWAPWLSY
jgi:hypothetical protein